MFDIRRQAVVNFLKELGLIIYVGKGRYAFSRPHVFAMEAERVWDEVAGR